MCGLFMPALLYQLSPFVWQSTSLPMLGLLGLVQSVVSFSEETLPVQKRGFLLTGKLLFLQPTGQAQRFLRNQHCRDYSRISSKKSLLFPKNV